MKADLQRRAAPATQRKPSLERVLDRYSVTVLQLPFLILFGLFVLLPVFVAVGLSFTDFNSIQRPSFIGLRNYVDLFTRDTVFMQFSLPNTVLYAIVVGVGGYILSFFL